MSSMALMANVLHANGMRVYCRVLRFVRTFALLAVTVIATFAVVLLPFMIPADQAYTNVAQIVHRVFPLARGLFEDKVANVWCSISPVLKMKEWALSSIIKLWYVATLALQLQAH
jgi:alpha-1,3-glucosyltransferase